MAGALCERNVVVSVRLLQVNSAEAHDKKFWIGESLLIAAEFTVWYIICCGNINQAQAECKPQDNKSFVNIFDLSRGLYAGFTGYWSQLQRPLWATKKNELFDQLQ